MDQFLHFIRLLRAGDPSCLRRTGWSRFVLMGLLLAGPIISYSQSTTVTGQVTAADDGSPLPGVTVLLKNSNTGTSTDNKGNFSLTVPDMNGTLVFSFIGYKTEEVALGNETSINMKMSPDVTSLGEVVIVGYGTVKKTDLTGAVGLVDNEQITKRATVGAMEAMQGQVAGVDISSTNGRAGAGFNIQIRGVQSLAGGQPLYVVDGVIVPDGIDFLNPQDIERIDILKDASSTAIYGSRGAYGVVLVTTKGGATQKSGAVIAYDGYVGVRQVARMPQFMDGTTWWNWRQDSFISDALVKGQPIPANPGVNTTTGELERRVAEKDFTDWPSLVTQSGMQSNHYLSLSGRADKIGYTFGIGYQEEDGNVINDNYKRYNLKASIDHTLSEHWNAGLSVNLSLAEHDMGSPNVMVEGFRMSPLLSPYNTETGELILQPGKDAIDGQTPVAYHIDLTSSVNPLMEVGKAWVERNTTYAIGNIFLGYSRTGWLSFQTTFAPRFTMSRLGQFTGTGAEGNVNGLPQGRIDNEQAFSYVWDNQVNVNKTFGDHSLSAMGLFSANSFVDESSFLRQTKMDANARGYYTTGVGGDPTTITSGGYWSKETIASFALRANYAYRDKYLLTVSNRIDGSSILSEGHKWQTFPSAALAWKVTEESFMGNAAFLNLLKLRASYGVTGNNRVPRYSTIPTASSIRYYDFDNTTATGIAPDRIANDRLTWEKTSEFNFGLDFGLFTSRITGSVDIYHKTSEDLLVDKLLPLENGYSSVVSNAAEVLNKGVEIGLTTTNISTDAVTWTTTFNFARNNNTVTEVYGGTDRISENRNDGYAGDDWIIKGESLGSYYNWVADGVWQAGDDNALTYGQSEGQGRVIDFDNSGTITESDKRVIGSTLPRWTGGFNSTLTFRNFDLSVSCITRQGVTAFSQFHQEFTNHEDRGRAKLDIDWYMQENPVTQTRTSNSYPQPKNAGNYWRQFNVGYYRDASFVKVKNITLGYNIPASALSKLKLNSVRVYATALNPIVITDYDGFDPEWATAGFVPTNVGSGAFGQGGGLSSTTYLVGVNLKF
ncbi:MAG TPA: TonB-dependent receptor [Chryseosolibacter sp.]|nr:TonB-dependent receptor [Chryseosolibacter sp.]